MGDVHCASEHLPFFRSLNERYITRISLDLNSKVGACQRNIDTVGKRLYHERMREHSGELFFTLHGDDEVEIEAHERLHVGVDRLPADDAVANHPVLEELKESIEEFGKVGRTAEVERYKKELGVVQEYLPKELSADELKVIVQQIITATGAASAKDMGKVMKEVLAKAPSADGKIVSQLVREILK